MRSETDSNDCERENPEHMYVLRLYVTGATTNSQRAVIHIKEICEKYLPDNYTLEIIDVYQQKEIAEQEQIIALPLLIKTSPLPVKRMIGDLSDTASVLRGLGISL